VLHLRRQAAGFTLTEMIVVIVLLGVLAIGTSRFLIAPIESYAELQRRQELVDMAEMSLRRIARDIRRALPNSLRLSCNQTAANICNAGNGQWALEMINTADGARYRDQPGTNPDGEVHSAQSDRLRFTAAGDASFNILGQFQNVPLGVLTGHRVVIYNTTNNIYTQADAATGPAIPGPGVISNAGDITLVLDDDEHQIQLNNVWSFQFQSPQQRLFLVDGPISYVCDEGTNQLTRYRGIGAAADASYRANHTATDTDAELVGVYGAGSDAIMARFVTGCAISYAPGTNSRAGLVTITLQLTNAGETISVLHQIHVVNVP